MTELAVSLHFCSCSLFTYSSSLVSFVEFDFVGKALDKLNPPIDRITQNKIDLAAHIFSNINSVLLIDN